MKVHAIVTGELEKAAIERTLTRVFPALEFVSVQRVDGITSSDLSRTSLPSGAQTLLDKFAAALVAAADPGRDGKAPDLVLALDDALGAPPREGSLHPLTSRLHDPRNVLRNC